LILLHASRLPLFQTNHLAENAKNLLDCLLSRDALSERLIRVITYASLLQSVDGTNPLHQANAALAASLVSAVRANLSFIDSEVLALPEQTLQDYIEQEDGLKDYAKTLADLAELKPHRLSSETEEVLKYADLYRIMPLF
jgi:oligoendopeptidase F